jgi:hypothetical protein
VFTEPLYVDVDKERSYVPGEGGGGVLHNECSKLLLLTSGMKLIVRQGFGMKVTECTFPWPHRNVSTGGSPRY